MLYLWLPPGHCLAESKVWRTVVLYSTYKVSHLCGTKLRSIILYISIRYSKTGDKIMLNKLCDHSSGYYVQWGGLNPLRAVVGSGDN